MDTIINNLADHGPWGLMVAVLVIGNAAQWSRSGKREDELRELSIQTATALVEFNMIEHAKRR